MGGHTAPRNGKTNSWITPKYILDALGPFDLDPCACIPQSWPTARVMWTKEDDGLSQDWPLDQRIWLNSPYGAEATHWFEKMAVYGRQGTALLFARTETKLFHHYIWPRAHGIFFLYGRVDFYRPDGTKATNDPGAPSVLVTYGYRDTKILQRAVRRELLAGYLVRLEGVVGHRS